MPVNFNGQLGANEIFAAIYNMIISQEAFADNISGTGSTLVDMSRVDGGLYGDRKLYYATDVLKSYAWTNDAMAGNLLETHRPPSPKCQVIKLDVFRQIALTTDDYMTKRAWSTEGAFSSFASVMMGWIGETKKIYDATTYNAFIGTIESAVGKQTQTVDVTSAVGAATGEDAARIEGAVIGEMIANLLVDLQDTTYSFNDYGFMRSLSASDLVFIWSAKAVSRIEHRDLPTIYHKDIVERLGEFVLPSRFFGRVNNDATKGTEDGKVRSLIEQEIGANHYFAGDSIKTTDTAPAKTSYTEDDTILFKVMHRRSVPYMSAFEVGTSFYNPQALLTNQYLTWGHNTLDYLANYPMITVRKA